MGSSTSTSALWTNVSGQSHYEAAQGYASRWSVRNRIADAIQPAKEVDLSLRPHELEELQSPDHRYQRIAPLSAQRVRYLLEECTHLMHQAHETGKEKRKQAREANQKLFTDMGLSSSPQGHRTLKGTSLQCTQCKKRVNKHMKMLELWQAQTEGSPTLGATKTQKRCRRPKWTSSRRS